MWEKTALSILIFPKSGTRILSDNYTKEDVQDFALWKAVAEDEEAKFKSPWGWGRPGWHIECSVMSQEILGETFDIHLGGIDLMFPHHENEIAQAEGKTGKKFANYFIHGAHLFVDGRKMSKSLNNFYTLADIIKKGFDPLALRYLYLQTHYRQEMNFTWESLEGAQKALMRLRTDSQGESEGNQSEGEVEEKLVLFQQAVNDDLNMPQGLAVLWELLKLRPSLDRIKAIEKIDQVFSLELLKPSKKPSREIPDEVIALVQQRSSLRKGKRFHLADQLRNKIKKMGYEVTDEDGETIVTKIPKV